MNIRLPLMAGLTTLAGLGLFSCQSPTSTTAPAPAAVRGAIVDTIAVNPHGGGGQFVPMDQITPCLQAYATTMAQYGITPDSPAVPTQKCPPMTYRITTSESFTYLTLRHLLDSLALSIDSSGQGANVNLQILPGIITQQLATAYNLPASHVGRITYFLVPSLITSAPGTNAKLKAAPAGSGGGGGSEVGDVEP